MTSTHVPDRGLSRQQEGPAFQFLTPGSRRVGSSDRYGILRRAFQGFQFACEAQSQDASPEDYLVGNLEDSIQECFAALILTATEHWIHRRLDASDAVIVLEVVVGKGVVVSRLEQGESRIRYRPRDPVVLPCTTALDRDAPRPPT